MKIKELKEMTADIDTVVSMTLHRILGVPMEDCTPGEMSKIASKLNDVCVQENNGDILLAIAQDTAVHSLHKIQKFSPILLFQIILMFGFSLGYLYRSQETRNRSFEEKI